MKDSGVIKAVIFDLDDTLVSEYEYVQSGYRYVSKRLEDRLGRTADEIFERLTELSKETYSRAFNRLFDSYGIEYTDEEMLEVVHAYRDHPAELHFYPDVYPSLRALKERGILTGIISDGDPERQRNKLRFAADLTDTEDGDAFLFDEIILNDEFGGAEFRKPNPRGFVEMYERLGVKPSEMIYVGDNPAKDFHIASSLPIRTARIIRDNGIYRDREYLDGIRETWRIDALTDIIKLVDERMTSGNAENAGVQDQGIIT